jgi:hypothetical protein
MTDSKLEDEMAEKLDAQTKVIILEGILKTTGNWRFTADQISQSIYDNLEISIDAHKVSRYLEELAHRKVIECLDKWDDDGWIYYRAS